MRDEVQNIGELRKEVKSLQKSVSIILNRLPYMIHDELTQIMNANVGGLMINDLKQIQK